MKTTLVAAFGNFLQCDINSSKEFLEELPDSKNITKFILPVGYFKNDFIKPIKKIKPERIILIGMDDYSKNLQFEIIAKNAKITFKNPIRRFITTLYSYWLRLNNKNFRTTKPIPKELLTIVPIEMNKPLEIKLHSKPPQIAGIKISKNAGNYICNYSMWVIENYLICNKQKTEFYFIHIPQKLNTKQKKNLMKFVLN